MRVLIIDEEPNIRRLLSSALLDNYEAVAVSGWIEAMAEMDSRGVDVVLLHFERGGARALDFLSRLAVTRRRAGLIAYGPPEMRALALQHGAVRYLGDPLNAVDLRQALLQIKPEAFARPPSPEGETRMRL